MGTILIQPLHSAPRNPEAYSYIIMQNTYNLSFNSSHSLSESKHCLKVHSPLSLVVLKAIP